ncbi:MAG: hypothetical protein GY898_22335 [Proteobacteria bacterium]|nr:hypothetical protein [Pseudomonadota bacterium]
MRSLLSPDPSDRTGESLIVVDLDGDGLLEAVIGAPAHDEDRGRIWIVPLFEIDQPGEYWLDEVAWSVLHGAEPGQRIGAELHQPELMPAPVASDFMDADWEDLTVFNAAPGEEPTTRLEVDLDGDGDHDGLAEGDPENGWVIQVNLPWDTTDEEEEGELTPAGGGHDDHSEDGHDSEDRPGDSGNDDPNTGDEDGNAGGDHDADSPSTSDGPWDEPGQMTVSTGPGVTLDDIPVGEFLDSAAGREVVVDGNLRHGVTLKVPAGRGGFGPEVSVQFEQGVRSNEFGLHWGLSAVSSISRRSWSGGQPRGDGSDTFWVDGEQLILVSSAPVPEYRRQRRTGERFFYDASNDDWLVNFEGSETTYGEPHMAGGRVDQRPAVVTSSEVPWGVLPPAQPGTVISSRWWLARHQDASGNQINYFYRGLEETVLLRSISWSQGNYELEFDYESRPGHRFVAQAGEPGYLSQHLVQASLIENEGASQTLRRWTFDYQLTLPGREILLRDITVHGHAVAGITPDPVRVRRFHYHHELEAPLEPGDWAGLDSDDLDDLMAGADPAEFWSDETPLSIDFALGPPGREGYPHVTTRLIHANHDALPDLLLLYASSQWIAEERAVGAKQPMCGPEPENAGECSGEGQPFVYNPTSCNSPLAAKVLLNEGGLNFVEAPPVQALITDWLDQQGPPTANWDDLWARIVITDLNQDGMDDFIGPATVLHSPRTEGWETVALGPDEPVNAAEPLWMPIDIDGDGMPERVYPPRSTLGQWTSGESIAGHPMLSAEIPGMEGGLCIVPPARNPGQTPRWHAGFMNGSGDPAGGYFELSLPFFGGPFTALTSDAYDLPASGPFISQLPCDVDGEPGVLIPAGALASFDHNAQTPWLAPTVWEYIASQIQLGDVSGDGCADASFAVDLNSEILGAGVVATLGGNQMTFSEVFYGDCAGGFHSEAPLAGRDALGGPSARLRFAPLKEAECGDLPFQGLALARSCDDPGVPQVWAAPWCTVEPDEYLCCDECGGLYEICWPDNFDYELCPDLPAGGGPGDDDDVPDPPDGDDVETVALEIEIADDGPPPPDAPDWVLDMWLLLQPDWDPYLRHRYERGLADSPHGPGLYPIVGGQWVDTDGDGALEWLQVCTVSGYPNPSASQPPWAPVPATDLEARTAYPLALHYPQSHDDQGAGAGQSCLQRPARRTDLDFVGGMSALTSEAFGAAPSEARPLARAFHLGKDHAAFVVDLDGDGFPDYLRGDGTSLTVRLNQRQIPESTLVAITYPTGTAELGQPLSEMTGTSYLSWRFENALDHPLRPYPQLALAEVLDGTGHRVFQRYGCRIEDGRPAGCAVILAQGARGALRKTLYATSGYLAGMRWVDARYDAAGQLVEVDISIPESERAGSTSTAAIWERRSCSTQVPAGPFDGELWSYVAACTGFSAPHPGSAAIPFADVLALQQTAEGEVIEHLIPWPGGLPLSIGVPPTPFDMHARDVEIDEFAVHATATVDHGSTLTIDDDRVTTLSYAPTPDPDGPQLVGSRTEAFGAHTGVLQEVEYGWTDWTVTSTTVGTGASAATTVFEFDSYGRATRTTDPDGISSLVTGRYWCGGASGRLEHEQLWLDSDATFATYDDACQPLLTVSTSGAEETMLRDGFGGLRRSVIEPRGDQPALSAWSAPSRIGYGTPTPQHMETDGERLALTYINPRGQTWRTRDCQWNGPELATDADVLQVSPSDGFCAAGTEVDRLFHYSEDGLIVLESDPHTLADGPSRWTAHEYDSMRRAVATSRVRGSEADVLAGGGTVRLRTVRNPLHDGEEILLPDGQVHRIQTFPLLRQERVNGVLLQETHFSPDGLPLETTDAIGRLTISSYDSLRRPEAVEFPSFLGVDEHGGWTTHHPRVESTYTLAGRPSELIFPDGNGTRTLRDGAGRDVGRETLGHTPLREVDLPLPILPGSPSEAVRSTGFLDPDGDEVTVHRDGLGRVVGTERPEGIATSVEYDAWGRLSSSVDATGLTTTLAYVTLSNGSIKVTTTYDDGSAEWSITAATGELLRSVDRDGVFRSWTYDDWGRRTAQFLGGADVESLDPVDFGDLEAAWVWDHLDRLRQECLGSLACTTYDYDARGRVERITRGPQTWELTWNDADELTLAELVAGPDSFQIVPIYNAAGHLIATDVDGIRDGQTDYDVMGRPARFVPSVPGTGATRWIYDTQGRLEELQAPGAAPTRYGYWPDGALQWVDDGYGALDQYLEYDAAGRVITATDAAGLVVHSEYSGPDLTATWTADADTGAVLSRREFVRNASTGRLEFVLDAIETSCAAAVSPGGTVADCGSAEYASRRYEWSAGGRRQSVTDPEGSAAAWSYDFADGTGRLESWATDTLSKSYSYDSNGQLTQVDRGSGSSSEMVYDTLGQLLSVIDIEGGETETSSFQYDVRGRTRWSAVERNGAYVEEVFSDYDARGLLVQQGRVLDGATPSFSPNNGICDAGELCFEYDELGRRTSVVYPDQRDVAFEYVDGRLQRVFDGYGGPPMYEVRSRDVRGRPEEVWRAGDVYEQLVRDRAGRVSERHLEMISGVGPSSPSSTLVDVLIDRDAAGRLTARSSATFGPMSMASPESGERSYGYNAMGWLTSETVDDESVAQTFDRAGNRLSRFDAFGDGFSATYGADNRIETIDRTDAPGPFVFAYDNFGRRKGDEDGRTFGYTPRGRLEEVFSAAGNLEAEYDYGVGGGRVREDVAGSVREFTYAPDSWFPWVTTEGGADSNEVMVGGQSIATLDPLSGVTSSLTDATANPFLRTDAAGEPNWTGSWDAYGADETSIGVAPPTGFKGMLGSNGAIPYLSAGHRDYDPLTGTWLEPDPIGVDGDALGNQYRFADGDPVNLADPSGLCVNPWVMPGSTRAQMRAMLTGSFKGPVRLSNARNEFYDEYMNNNPRGPGTWKSTQHATRAQQPWHGPLMAGNPTTVEVDSQDEGPGVPVRVGYIWTDAYYPVFRFANGELRYWNGRELQPLNDGEDGTNAGLLTGDELFESHTGMTRAEARTILPDRETAADIAGSLGVSPEGPDPEFPAGGWGPADLDAEAPSFGKYYTPLNTPASIFKGVGYATGTEPMRAFAEDAARVMFRAYDLNEGHLWDTGVSSANAIFNPMYHTVAATSGYDPLRDQHYQLGSFSQRLAIFGGIFGAGMVASPLASGGAVARQIDFDGLALNLNKGDFSFGPGPAFKPGPSAANANRFNARVLLPNDGPGGTGYGYSANTLVDRFAEEYAGAVNQANRILEAGGDGGTAWGRRHQIWTQEGRADLTSMSRGNALQQIANDLMTGGQSRSPLRSYDDLDRAGARIRFNQADFEGIRNSSGSAVRPDIQIRMPGGALFKIDLTSAAQAAKIELYYGPQSTGVFNIVY